MPKAFAIELQTKKKTNIISKQNIDIAKSVFFIVIFVKVAHNVSWLGEVVDFKPKTGC
jgi:hypothetical protein